MSSFAGGTGRVSLLHSACSQVPAFVQDQDTFQEGLSTPGIELPHAPTGSHISAEIRSNSLTDPVVFGLLQDPQHGNLLCGSGFGQPQDSCWVSPPYSQIATSSSAVL